jgi:LmbE family N-acetylglucosaminyl deacetylase
MSERKLLAVFAHPDDETFGTGGTLAHYARQGVEVYLVCATRGEVGEAPPGLKGFASAGEMREDELRCAASLLGLKAVYFLGYRDSGMPGAPDNAHPRALVAQPVEQVARQIAGYIRKIGPQVVITFDPIGGYRHPDHIAIHNATVLAVELAADSKQAIDHEPAFAVPKVYFSTFSRRFLRWGVRLIRLMGQDPQHFGKNKDIDLTALVDVDFPIHASVSIRDVATIKQRAAACHSSQGGGLPRPLRFADRWFGGNETFMRAKPPAPPARLERDLFEGLSSSGPGPMPPH